MSAATGKDTRRQNLLLEVEDAANIADDTLRIAHSLVRNGIGSDGHDVDELVALSCVLDRVSAQIKKASNLAEAVRKVEFEARQAAAG